MTSYLFVYGTLRRGCERHEILSSQRFVGCAATIVKCRLVDCGSYPALVESTDGVSVHGELYEVDPMCLEKCDAAEGVAEGLYERRMIDVVSLDGALVHVGAWVYFYRHSTLCFPSCGNEWTG